MKRVLFLSYFIPFPLDAGGKVRQFNLIDRLRHKFRITLMVFLHSEKEFGYLAELRRHWPQVEIIVHTTKDPISKRPSLLRRIARLLVILNPFSLPWFLRPVKDFENEVRTLLLQRPFDLLVCEFTQMGGYLPKNISIPAVWVEQDLTFVAWKRRFQNARGIKNKIVEYILYYKIKRFELLHFKKFNSVIVMSELDKIIVRQLVPQARVEVIPNGVDVNYFHFDEVKLRGVSKLFYVGWFGHYPNQDAARYFVEEIWPILDCRRLGLTCDFAGKYVEEQVTGLRGLPGIRLLGYVEDIRPFLLNSIFIVPLRIGGGTRLKILEAMAAGCPVVSTTIGAEGIQAEHGKHFLIADTPREFAAAIERLVRDSGLRERLRRNARKLVEAKYSWERIVKKQEELFRQLL